jgi:hypothetical protein
VIFALRDVRRKRTMNSSIRIGAQTILLDPVRGMMKKDSTINRADPMV